MEHEFVRVAAVAPATLHGENETKNVKQAVEYIAEAANLGARLVVFPEAYPGPCAGPMTTMSTSAAKSVMKGAAEEHKVYVAFGQLEEARRREQYHLSHTLVSPSGTEVFHYRRCQPTPPALNAHLYGGKRHLVPGDELFVEQLDGIGQVGCVICSELKVPELARILMLRGAEILINPVGGAENPRSIATPSGSYMAMDKAKMGLWTAVAQARAIENLMYVIITANAGGPGTSWGSSIVGPEGVISQSEGPGILCADLDMERLRLMRSRAWTEDDFLEGSPIGRPFLTDPGQHRDRRPDFYEELVKPQASAFRFDYVEEHPVHSQRFDAPNGEYS